MKTFNIKNSSSIITGTIIYENDKFLINNLKKPQLIIDDKEVVKSILQKDKSEDFLLYLYNKLNLSISEIAAMYEVCYSAINKLFKRIPNWKADSKGRRNRAYGQPVSKAQSEKISKALTGRHSTSYYERTPEIREKISQSLKKYFSQHPQNPKPHIENWEKGVYDNVDFKIGIGGHFASLKMKTKIRFRSLLELYFLILLEENEKVLNYIYEPFHISMDNGRTYAPDFLINNKIVVELKAKKYVARVEGVKEKVEYKQSQAIKYCDKHGLEYKIIYDEDINFDSRRMKQYINNNPDIINKYNINFIDPSRVVKK